MIRIPSEVSVVNSRFHSLLSDVCPRPLYDIVLRDTGAMVVTPTLGSIIPNWVLAIPRQHASNAASWARGGGGALLPAIKAIAGSFGRRFSDVIWFEHGAVQPKSIVGCGVDHAHIHILLRPPFGFDQFCAEALSQPGLSWSRGRGDGYASINSSQSYLVAGSDDQFLFAQSAEAAGSQFFRKAIARLVGKEDSWDYKIHPHAENVAETVANALAA